MQNASAELINQSDLDQTLSKIVTELVQKLDYVSPSVYLLNPDKQSFSVRKLNVPKVAVEAAERILGKSIYEIKFDIKEENLLTRTFREGKINMTNDLYELLIPHIQKIGARLIQNILFIRTIIVAPIDIEGESIGILVLASKQKDIPEVELNVVKTFADQISIAIYNSQQSDAKQKTTDCIRATKQRSTISIQLNI